MISEYRNKYGYSSSGLKIEIPNGWEMVEEGCEIPNMHRECIEDYTNGRIRWCGIRRCHSTMTPMYATVWGGVRVFAKKVENKEEL